MSRFLTCLALILASAFPVLAADGESRPESITAEEFFKGGRVTGFKARRITINYDIGSPECLSDFLVVNPFLLPPKGGFEVKEGAIHASGVGALVHKGVFEADVLITAKLVAETPRDLGIVLTQPGGTDQYLLFALADNFFSKRDRQALDQHMITVVGARDDDGEAGETLFRYLVRSRKPVLAPGYSIDLEVRKRAKRNRMTFAGKSLDAEDRYGSFPAVQPGVYVLDSSMTVTALTISGKLTEEFLVKHGIAFDPSEEDDQAIPEIRPAENEPEDEPRAERPRGRRSPRQPAGGGSDGMRLIRKIRDDSLAEAAREEAAGAITKKMVKVDEFRALLDCLYSRNLMTRTLAIKVLKRSTGKTFGYNPKAREESRKKSIRTWFKYFTSIRDRLR